MASAAGPRRVLGFTLIELMIVVAIVGILAAIAIPGFSTYVKRSKTAEAMTQLDALYKSVADFYSVSGSSGRSWNAFQYSSCIVPSASMVPSAPSSVKATFAPSTDSSFALLGFAIGDYVYYGYGIDTIGDPDDVECGRPAGQPAVYTLYAHGDLDGDGNLSTFEVAVGSDAGNSLYRARGFYVHEETE